MNDVNGFGRCPSARAFGLLKLVLCTIMFILFLPSCKGVKNCNKLEIPDCRASKDCMVVWEHKLDGETMEYYDEEACVPADP